MGKRFTETSKWADAWFRSLTAAQKCGWLYLCDNCDMAGVIDIDRELANFQIRDTLDWDAFIEAAGERIVRLKSGKLWLTRFIKYQYGHEFPSACKPHLAVLKLLDVYAKTDTVIEQYRQGFQTLKDKDKAKEKNRKGERGKPKVTAADVPLPDGFDTPEVLASVEAWLAYKAKRGKSYSDAGFFGRKVAEFAAAGPEAFIAAVSSSIGNNYDGIFPAKDLNGKQSTTSRVGPGQRFRG